jgi:hypothetical protein
VLALIPKLPCHDQVNQPIGLRIEGKKLSLRGRGSGDPKWTDLEIAEAEGKGNPVTIYLNRSLLSKALGFGLNQIEITDPLTPLRFSNGGRQMIVMPVRGEASPESSPSAAEESPQTSEPSPSTERTIVQSTSNGAATNGATPKNGSTTNGDHQETKPAIEMALEKIELTKGLHHETLRSLNDLADNLKQVQREQKTTDKEVQSVRTTLEKLQSVRL